MPTINRTRFLNSSLNDGQRLKQSSQSGYCYCAIGAYFNGLGKVFDSGNAFEIYNGFFKNTGVPDSAGLGINEGEDSFSEWLECNNNGNLDPVAVTLKLAEEELMVHKQGIKKYRNEPRWDMEFKLRLLDKLIKNGILIEEETSLHGCNDNTPAEMLAETVGVSG